jgi:hypothetical protein
LNLKIDISELLLLANARARSRRDIVRGHIRAPPYASYLRRARTPRRRETSWSEARAASTVHLRLMTRVRGLGRCHAAHAYPRPLAADSAARRHRLRAHSLAPVGHDGEAEPPLQVLEPIEPSPSSFPCAPAQPSEGPIRRTREGGVNGSR